jgi:hypothetical protein
MFYYLITNMSNIEELTKRVDSHIESFEKRFQKHDELRLIDGDHMSHIRADLTDVKNILIKNAEETKKYREVVDAHMARVEPVIKAYEEALIIKQNDEKRATNVGKWAVLVTSISILGTAIIWVVNKIKGL